ncbi:MAG: VacJ family lipoprotein [Desulfarculus sp.]|nr:VacJ family lipoprotein [Desulfarculus sp.]
MKRLATFSGIMVLMLLLANCAAHQPVQAPPDAPAAVPPGQPSAGPPAQAQAPASGGNLDSEEDILADLANDPQAAAAPVVADPLEPVNRAIFQFNDGLYIHVLDPTARGYKQVVPPEVRQGIKNFFSNLMTPLRMVSSVLQGKIERACQETARFILNTTLGILGMGDAALDLFELPAPPKEDLGQVMGTWGLDHGFYLVLPVLGPSSLRDGVGWFGGAYLDPVWYLPVGFWEASGIKSYEWFHRYSFVEGEYADLAAGAVDPYVAMRDFYLQYRARELRE